MFYKKNLITIGLLLVLIFTAAVWLVGIGIDRTARTMRQAMIEEVGKYRVGLITLDLQKTVELSVSIREYFNENLDNEKGLRDLLKGLVRMDRKVTRIWYLDENKKAIVVDSLGVMPEDAVLTTTLQKITNQGDERGGNRLYYSDGILYWTTYQCLEGIIIGLDVSLPGLHEYFAGKSPDVKSYAYILNAQGILLTHPDEDRIGRTLANSDDEREFEEVIRRNKIAHCKGFSQYLMIPVERVYYPVTIGHERWVIVVNVPEFVTQEEMADFHRYTLFILIITVLVFSILLTYSQRRWRKEFDRRRKLEQETLQLNIQQLKNQINPHFLFNSLNSLNVLIGTDPAVAKEFVLKLSKIYRYVLEKRNDSLVAVSEEINFIRHYYFLQKIRFQEQLSLEIESGLNVEKREIPVMSLQILIENAIKHNEITRQSPLYIHIYLKEEAIMVENTYHPRVDTAEDSLGIGLESIQKIYAYCSEKQFSYRIEGEKFICTLPLM